MVTRTYGLSGSGIDVDSMVKQLMQAQRASYDKVWQQKTQLEWKKTDYNTIYTLTNSFRNSTIFDFRKSASLAPKQVTSTNDMVVSATANADAANVTHSITVTQLADGVKLSSSGSITASGRTKDTLVNQFGLTVGSTLDFTINGKQITINVGTTTSINDVVSAINNSDAGVKANYDSTLDRFYLYTNKTGAASTIDFTGSTTDGLNFFQNNLKIDTTTRHGQDASFTLDGVALTKDSNNFTISGVSYTLKATSPVDSATSQAIPTTINVQPDIDKTVDAVKNFVADYNTYLAAINKELNADYNRDYLPLTDDQKSQMKDSEISAWEAKAKTGLLRHDSILDSIVTNMRLNFTTPVSGLSGKYRSAADIGIETGSYITSDGLSSEIDNGGKLYVDEDKLRAALAEDPDAVYKIFGTSGDTIKTEGVANRLYDQLRTSLQSLKDKAGLPDAIDTKSTLYNEIKDYNTRLDNMNDRLKQMEDNYYAKFDAMEEALSKLNQQSSWLLQQLG